MTERREFIKHGGLAGILLAASAPAIAQNMPEVKWRLTSSAPKSLDTLYGAAEDVARFVAEATDNKFQIRVFASGEIVPGLQALDAVQNSTVEACHTASYYYFGKDPTFAFDTAVPFGLNARQMAAWMFEGNGQKLMRDFMKGYNVVCFPAGNTGAQMGGFYRKEIRKPEDLKGLKMRIGGFGGLVLQKLGAIPQQIAGGEIYAALEKGTVDAAEWVGPYDDEKFGLYKTGAKNYYYPGWWEPCSQWSCLVNLKAWEALPKHYQAVLEAACSHAMVISLAKYDGRNPAALKRLVSAGVAVRPFPNEVMEACFKASLEIYADLSARNPTFKKVYDDMVQFRNEEILWFRVAERTFDEFMIKASQMSLQSKPTATKS